MVVGLRKQTNLQLFEFIFAEKCSSFLCGRPFERWIQFSHAWFSWHFIIDISHHACIRIIWDPGIIFGLRYFIGILRNSKFGNSVPSSKNYTEAKGMKVHKRFPKYGGKYYLHKFGFYEFN